MTPKQRAFLAAFPITCSVQLAARAARVHRSRHYCWLQDPAYREAWQTVQDQAGQTIQDEMVRRAMGIRRLLYYNGKPVLTGHGRSARFYVEVEYDNRLLIELLRIFRPDKYSNGARHADATGGAELVERLAAARARLAAARGQDSGAAVA